MYMIRKAISIFIVMILMSITAINVCADLPSIEEQEREYTSLKSYHEITSQFHLNDNLPSTCYPDYYGGLYLDSEKKLVFLQVEGTSIPNELKQTIDSHDIVLQFCNTSYCTLSKQKENIVSYLDMYNRSTYHQHIAWGAGIDVINNMLLVNLYIGDSNNIESVLSAISQQDEFSSIKINVYNDMPELCSAVKPGTKISSSNGTVGYWATNASGQLGIVTAGHVASGGSSVSINGNTFGPCVTSTTYGSADAAFVRNDNPGFSPSRTILGWGFEHRPYASITLPTGSLVYAYGYNSLSHVGTVKIASYLFSFGSYYISDAAVTNITGCAGGDSGGPVVGALSNNLVSIAGTIEAQPYFTFDGVTAQYMIYNKAPNITSALGGVCVY